MITVFWNCHKNCGPHYHTSQSSGTATKTVNPIITHHSLLGLPQKLWTSLSHIKVFWDCHKNRGPYYHTS